MFTKIALVAALAGSFSAFSQSVSNDPMGVCQQLIQGSQSDGVHVLIVAIEGTAQYDAKDADDLYNYSRARKFGPVDDALPTLRANGGLLTDGLLFPLLREFGDRVDALSFNFNNPFFGQQTAAKDCALLWMKSPNHKVIIMGHSTGAGQAINLSNALYNVESPAAMVVTVDAVRAKGAITRPFAVERYLNFYQTMERDFMYKGQPADGESPGDVNLEITRQTDPEVEGHMTITRSHTVYDYVSGALSELLQ